MNLFQIFTTIDSSLGKVDKDSFPQQTLMEMALERTATKQRIYSNESTEISQWNGVGINENGEVMTIDWKEFNLRGEVRVDCLPNSVEYFSVSINYLLGSLDLTDLPRELHALDVSDNVYTGDICLTCLPPCLERLDVSRNQFGGSIDLTSLPPKLQVLNLSTNYFEGEIDCSRLPESLSMLNFSFNDCVSGTLQASEKRTILCRNTNVHVVERWRPLASAEWEKVYQKRIFYMNMYMYEWVSFDLSGDSSISLNRNFISTYENGVSGAPVNQFSKGQCVVWSVRDMLEITMALCNEEGPWVSTEERAATSRHTSCTLWSSCRPYQLHSQNQLYSSFSPHWSL